MEAFKIATSIAFIITCEPPPLALNHLCVPFFHKHGSKLARLGLDVFEIGGYQWLHHLVLKASYFDHHPLRHVFSIISFVVFINFVESETNP